MTKAGVYERYLRACLAFSETDERATRDELALTLRLVDDKKRGFHYPKCPCPNDFTYLVHGSRVALSRKPEHAGTAAWRVSIGAVAAYVLKDGLGRTSTPQESLRLPRREPVKPLQYKDE